MVKLLQEKHRLKKQELYQKTAEILGQEFVITYSLENAENTDLFYKMFKVNFEQIG